MVQPRRQAVDLLHRGPLPGKKRDHSTAKPYQYQHWDKKQCYKTGYTEMVDYEMAGQAI